MAKRWINEPVLLDSLADNLLSAMSMFPKRLVRLDEIIREFQMPLSHIQILSLVSHQALTISQISARMGVAKPNVTPLVNRLDEMGFVSRIRSNDDRRIVQVAISDAGNECLSRIRGMIAEQIRNWPVDFSTGEVRHLNSSLGTLNRTMESMNEAVGMTKDKKR